MRKISILLSHYLHGLPSLKLHIRTNIYCCYSSIVHNAWSWSFTLSFLHFHLNCFNFQKNLAYKYAISFFCLDRQFLYLTKLNNYHSEQIPQKVLGHDNNNFWPSYLMSGTQSYQRNQNWMTAYRGRLGQRRTISQRYPKIIIQM
jgi:hypothetical protein